MGYTDKERKDDFQWFLDNYNKIFADYGVCYVAIQNKNILGTYATFGIAINQTAQKEKMGNFIVQYCNGDESGYTNYVASNEVGVI